MKGGSWRAMLPDLRKGLNVWPVSLMLVFVGVWPVWRRSSLDWPSAWVAKCVVADRMWLLLGLWPRNWHLS